MPPNKREEIAASFTSLGLHFDLPQVTETETPPDVGWMWLESACCTVCLGSAHSLVGALTEERWAPGLLLVDRNLQNLAKWTLYRKGNTNAQS